MNILPRTGCVLNARDSGSFKSSGHARHSRQQVLGFNQRKNCGLVRCNKRREAQHSTLGVALASVERMFQYTVHYTTNPERRLNNRWVEVPSRNLDGVGD